MCKRRGREDRGHHFQIEGIDFDTLIDNRLGEQSNAYEQPYGYGTGVISGLVAGATGGGFIIAMVTVTLV